MEKLELKHLAPYLPYKLQYLIPKHEPENIFDIGHGGGIHTMQVVAMLSMSRGSESKPILRPLSDLTKEIEVDGEKKRLIDDIQKLYPTYYFAYNATDDLLVKRENEQYTWCSDILGINEFLFKNHFDVFGLIEKGLAIDINTL